MITRIIGLFALIAVSCNNIADQQTNTRKDTLITWIHFPIWDEDGHVYQYKRNFDHIPTSKDSMEFRNFILQEMERQIAITKIARAEDSLNKEPGAPVFKHDTDTFFRLREGQHQFTLHTISWDQPGRVLITHVKDNFYNISGGQESKDNDDYINIEGTLKAISPLELEFDGIIKSFVANTHPEACTKRGKQIFLATKNRQYWRMQDMRLCDYSYTDYIDIYFK